MREYLNIGQSRSGLMLLVFDLGSLDTRRALNNWFIKMSNALNVNQNLHHSQADFHYVPPPEGEEALAILSFFSCWRSPPYHTYGGPISAPTERKSFQTIRIKMHPSRLR